MTKNNNRKKCVFFSAAVGLALSMSTTAFAQSSMIEDSVFTNDVLKSGAFQELISITFEPEALHALANVDINFMTGSIISGRIKHHYIPNDQQNYGTKAKIGVPRNLTQNDLNVRVVYANFLPMDDATAFER